jgi:hypothetical protein
MSLRSPFGQGNRIDLTHVLARYAATTMSVIPAERAGLCPASESRNPVLRFRGSNHIDASIDLVLRSALLRASRRTATSEIEPAAILRDGASRLLRMRSVCV